MHLSTAVSLPAMVGMGLANAAANAAREVRHSQDIRQAQRWIDHLAASARSAEADFEDVVAALSAARMEAAALRAALDESDAENLALSMDIRRMNTVRAN